MGRLKGLDTGYESLEINEILGLLSELGTNERRKKGKKDR